MTWDEYFLLIADTVRQKSKDPSSKIGAVIVNKDHSVLSTGFNGFPRGINETIGARWVRPDKYKYVAHAESNAIFNACKTGVALEGSTLYLLGMGPPAAPCTECAKAIIQSGIKRVVGRGYKPVPENWEGDFEFSLALLKEAGVEFVESTDSV